MRSNPRPAGGGHLRAFTITELMVAVALMGVIVFALYSVFNQTQKALRSNEAQGDVSEKGRAVVEMIARDIERAAVGMRLEVTNLYTIAAGRPREQKDMTAPSPVRSRTNALHNFYLLTRNERAWQGLGYLVAQRSEDTNGNAFLSSATNMLGSLYRHTTPEPEWEYQKPTTNLFREFLNLVPPVPGTVPGSNFSLVADGVIHFRMVPYDAKGQRLAFNTTNLDGRLRVFRADVSGSPKNPGSNAGATNATVTLRQAMPLEENETAAAFRSNALPSYLELELGVLEPEPWRQYQQMIVDGQAIPARTFIEKRISKVHIFRKRIPLRTAAQ